MQTTTWKEYHPSRMMLGTVQFGMPYGIANTTGKPAYDDVLAMVAAALDGGVNGFDTAAAYGDSETVLGQALRELNAIERVLVVTKVKALPPPCAGNPQLAEQTIRESVDASRHQLGMDRLPLVLFHREADGRHIKVLEKLAAEGSLQYFGVSGDNEPGPAGDLVEGGSVAALQLPANLLDRRHARSGILESCERMGIAVFIRSVYLQGLLLMPEPAIPPQLQAVLPVRQRLESLASRAGMGMAELAVRYMLAQPGITSVLTGVESLAQLRENLALFDRGPLPADLTAAVDAAVPELPADLLTPATWPNAWPKR